MQPIMLFLTCTNKVAVLVGLSITSMSAQARDWLQTSLAAKVGDSCL